MEGRRKARKELAKKVNKRLVRLNHVLRAKWIVEEMGAVSTYKKPLDFIVTYVLRVPFGLEEC